MGVVGEVLVKQTTQMPHYSIIIYHYQQQITAKLRKIQCLLSSVEFFYSRNRTSLNCSFVSVSGFCNAIEFLIVINFFDRD